MSLNPLPTVSVIVPTLNEADNIDTLLRAIFRHTADAPFATDVVVVDDGSADPTRARVRAWSADHPVQLVERDDEKGLAGAVIAGARCAAGDVVVVMDADLSHPAEALPALVGPVLDGAADMVVGSRYTRGGSTVGWPKRRLLMSRVASILAWPLVDVADPMSGFFAVRRERLVAVDPRARGFKIGLELLADGENPPRVAEVPITFHDRQAGQSKLGGAQVTAYLDRLRELAGGRVSTQSAMRFGIVGLLGMMLDSVCFGLLYLAGLQLATAHLASFVIACVFNYLLNARWSFVAASSARPDRMRLVRYTVIALMAISLRGAVLATLVQGLGWWPIPSVFVAIGVAALVSYLGYAFYVFPQTEPGVAGVVRWRVASVGLVGYIVLLRLFNIALPNLLMEEAYYWNYAKHPSLGYLDHPPMVAWLIGAGTWLFGDTEFGVRVGAIFCWGIAAAFGYAMAREMFSRAAAMRAVLLLAVLPFFFVTGFIMTPDAPLTACWAGALYFLRRALISEQGRAWWGVGLCIGLGMLSKYTISLLGPSILIFMLLDRKSRHWFKDPRPYAAVLLAVLLFSPVILWNARHDWASFAFQSVDRIQARPEFGLHLLIGSVLLLLTPVGLIAILRVLFQRQQGGTAGQASRPRPTRSRDFWFAAVFALTPLAVFAMFSISHEPKINWTGPLWLAVIPLVAERMADTKPLMLFNRPCCERIWSQTMTAAVLGYGLFLHYSSLGLPGVPYPDHFAFAGWRDLGGKVEAVEDRVKHERGEEPLVVGMDKYGISSRLAFYRLRDEPEIPHDDNAEAVTGTTGRHLVGGDSLMYEYWSPADGEVGRDIIFVDKDPGRLGDELLVHHFDVVSPLVGLDVESNGVSAGRFYYRVGYNYHQ